MPREAESLPKHHRRLVVLELIVCVSIGNGLCSAQDSQNSAEQPVIADSARRARLEASQNLRKLGLALHGYHDVYRHFPPPVLLGPDGKTRYSWRVELLPILKYYVNHEKPDPLTADMGRAEYQKIIAEFGYDVNLPWDSEQNRKVLTQMPDIFRSPSDDPTSTNAAYFAVVGEETAMGDTAGAGIPIRDVKDGASDTIVVVEAKRDIPWTKPEDITYSKDQELPQLGGWHEGGFYTVFCSGAVIFLPENSDEATLRAALTRNGGEKESFFLSFPPRR